MSGSTKSPLSKEQVDAWLRGLLTLAWCDGDFDDAEKKLISELTHQELALASDTQTLPNISAKELAAFLGIDMQVAENFLRTAVMVAIADGTYTQSEDQLLYEFCQALGLEADVLQSLRLTLVDHMVPTSVQSMLGSTPPVDENLHPPGYLHLLKPLQDWLDQLEIHDPKIAHFLCKMIPAQCPFERDIILFGRKVLHIPPLCKLNPLYEQLVSLRFRCLCYLADDCGEDVSSYC
jgi:tellurite resistance protein